MKNYWTLDSNNRLIHFHIQKKTWFVRSKLTLTVVFTLFGTCLGEILSSDPEFQTTRGLFLTPADHLCVPSLQSLICAPSRLTGRQRRWSHRQPAEKWIGCLPWMFLFCLTVKLSSHRSEWKTFLRSCLAQSPDFFLLYCPTKLYSLLLFLQSTVEDLLRIVLWHMDSTEH